MNTTSSWPKCTPWTRTPSRPNPSPIATIDRSVVVSMPPTAMPVRIAMREHGAAK
jgi:hypothetical protein